MQAIAAKVPELAGGSADLNPSTFTWLKGLGDFQSPAFSAEGLHGMVGGPWGYEDAIFISAYANTRWAL